MHLRRVGKVYQFLNRSEGKRGGGKWTNEVKKTSCLNRVRTFRVASPSERIMSTESSEVNLRSVLVPGTVVGRMALSSGCERRKAKGNATQTTRRDQLRRLGYA